jgi:GNAT superfamily N-acetyltransferase
MMSEGEVLIRAARQEDAGAIAGLLRGLGWFAQMAVETAEETAERVGRHLALCLADSSHSVYVAEAQEGGIVGYIAVHWLAYLMLSGPEGFISELFVDEVARGQGIGTRLLETVMVEAQERGCFRLHLVNIRQRESYQREFYPKHGWQERPNAANFVYLFEAV